MIRILRDSLKWLLVVVVATISFASCTQTEDEPEEKGNQGIVVLYAVAANNLYKNYLSDREEILKAAATLNLDRNKIVIYSVNTAGECQLEEVVKDSSGNACTLKTLKTYPKTPLSTEPERISEVLNLVKEHYTDYSNKGLILWSHATGWIPWFAGSNGYSAPRRSFGLDNYEGVGFQCNITDLADAIPADYFDYIWFDCCYMANIETIYQLKDKADYIVGYVTEIYNDGMPYDITLPYLLGSKADLQGAAWELFNDYDRFYRAVTVSITETSALEQLAEASAKIFEEGTAPPALGSIQNYSRLSGYKFYDMGQLLRSYQGIPAETLAAFNEAMGKAVVYKLASKLDFNNREINPEHYSGLSMHNYVGSESESEVFYAVLDWFKATRH